MTNLTSLDFIKVSFHLSEVCIKGSGRSLLLKCDRSPSAVAIDHPLPSLPVSGRAREGRAQCPGGGAQPVCRQALLLIRRETSGIGCGSESLVSAVYVLGQEEKHV